MAHQKLIKMIILQKNVLNLDKNKKVKKLKFPTFGSLLCQNGNSYIINLCIFLKGISQGYSLK